MAPTLPSPTPSGTSLFQELSLAHGTSRVGTEQSHRADCTLKEGIVAPERGKKLLTKEAAKMQSSSVRLRDTELGSASHI
ncbi:hypothetical protein P7K49_025042 [Saguinus oedipus]|uniref:Uncharacterized protein n=1 Tax=Saguinus oedipus TaxID=9490 RepID=A0ABQ9UHE6_SAGOE|nr:hypothetical protein P7K49_025042 [Saguinus oedipus]